MVRKIATAILVVVGVLGLAGIAWYMLVIYDPPPISDEDRRKISLMPLPASLEVGSGIADVSGGFEIILPENDDGRVAWFLERRRSVIPEKAGGIPLRIQIQEVPEGKPVQVREDESYALTVKDEILLTAPTVTGALRGLSTLYQYVAASENGRISYLSMKDRPRYPWRGLMLDVCRHWMPPEVLLRTLDAMELVKMNVLHLHLSEDQGFRVESRRFPKLHEVGSNGKYYTQEEIRVIIAYARDRGIRVVPEFDLPGHSKSWQIAYPALSSTDKPLRFGNKKGIVFTAPVNPAREYTYAFMDEFIGEMAALFPDPYFHIGGDEVNPAAWLENDSIVMFMEAQGLEDAHALQTYFINRMNELIAKHGKKMIGWEEVYKENIEEGVVIQSWKSHKSLVEAVRGGSGAILSTGYYLDLMQPAGTHYAVDPAIVPNAVEIRPDSGQWQMYDLTIRLGDNPLDSRLILFDRNPQEVFGVVSTMGEMTSFTGGKMEEGILTFSMATQFGEMDFQARLASDSLEGAMTLAMMSLGVSGTRIGASDLKEGEPLPQIEYLPPLTDAEKELILGGEACMWSEFVGMHNVESRIWPRAAAIAEKLWSPARLTTDVDDMYRRLSHTNDLLDHAGSPHRVNAGMILTGVCDGPCLEALVALHSIFEEVKYHARMTGLIEMDSFYLPETPLDRIVDAAAPESEEARQFNLDVKKYLENRENDSLKLSLEQRLVRWQALAADLQQYVQESDKLQDIRHLLPAIEKLCDAAVRRLHGEPPGLTEAQIRELLMRLEKGENYVVVAVYPGLGELLSSGPDPL